MYLYALIRSVSPPSPSESSLSPPRDLRRDDRVRDRVSGSGNEARSQHTIGGRWGVEGLVCFNKLIEAKCVFGLQSTKYLTFALLKLLKFQT